jgi:crotonobetainyl-CoA:carnitine CoA-transferase CaiB-like acyl-CoA transferase
MNTSHLPLQGIRVIEIAHALAGPLAANIMADLGADVIKVEKPDGGDDARQWGPPFGPDGEMSLYFHAQNRNKRGVTLDLKSPEGVEKLHFLCADADILIQTLRPGLVEKYGVDGKTMLTRHPRLIYCNVSAYGSEGPLAKHPGFDPLLQAISGIMSITGEPGSRPTFNGASINDKATGMFCAIGALAALHERERTGRGSIIDTSLFDAAVHWVEGPLNACLATGKVPQKHGTGSLYIVPYQVFEARDGALVIAAGNDRLFASCARILGHPEWADDERFSTAPQRVIHRAALIPLIEETVRPWERSALLDALEKVGVPCAPVNDIGELARSEQLQAVDILQSPPGSGVTVVGLPFKINGVRPKSAIRAPGLGEHNKEIFEEEQAVLNPPELPLVAVPS